MQYIIHSADALSYAIQNVYIQAIYAYEVFNFTNQFHQPELKVSSL